MSTSSEAVPDKAPMKKAPVTVETRKQSVDMQKKADEIDRRAWCTASSTRRGVWGTLTLGISVCTCLLYLDVCHIFTPVQNVDQALSQL